MEKKAMQSLAQKLGKDLKPPADVSKFSSMLTKLTFGAGLGAKMEQHLGYKKNGRSGNPDSRNGYGKKNHQDRYRRGGDKYPTSPGW